MKQSIRLKLESMSERFAEINVLLSDAEVIGNQNKFRALSKEYAQLEAIVRCYELFLAAEASLNESKQLLADENEDPDIKAMAKEEVVATEKETAHLEAQLQLLLLPRDPDDSRNIYLEIRAGTGGDEAAIFAGDLFRMYSRYAEIKKWRVEMVSSSLGEHGGFKEIIAQISGQDVYAHLKFESGAHRVQRVPETESQGRVHTSACTVAVMPEVEAVDDIQVKPDELRIDTFRASGAGGQHVNKTDSAIRITHLPTGMVVECQDDRSQHKNKAKALALLQSKLLAAEQNRQKQEQADTRRNLVGSGDRSERIRTYNFPQGRITDHRINLTLYKLSEIIEGELSQVIEPLQREYQTDLLAALSDKE